MKNRDARLIWEAYSDMGDHLGDMAIPSIGSHEKGKAIELIKLYQDMLNPEVKMTDDQFKGLLTDRWKDLMEDDDIDADQVLNHVMDQRAGARPGTVETLLNLYQVAKSEMPV